MSVPRRPQEQFDDPPGEVTFPGSSVVVDARITRAELRSARFIAVISVVSAVVLAFVMVLGFQLLRHVLGDRSVAVAECTEGEEVDRCAEDEICVRGRCHESRTPPVRCQLGGACPDDACRPDPKLRCDEETGRFVPSAPPDACEEPAVMSVLRDLLKKCRNPNHCKPSEIADFAIGREDFIDTLVRFPGAVTVYFPSGQPKSLTAWPGAAAEDHYIERIAPQMPAFERAHTIMLVALASRGGANQVLTHRRAQASQNLLIEAARRHGGIALDSLEKKLRLAYLGDRVQLDADFFAAKVVQRLATPDTKTEDFLGSLLEDPALPRESQDLRDRMINQVAFLVPIHCDLGDL
jgi:hypothetical protein